MRLKSRFELIDLVGASFILLSILINQLIQTLLTLRWSQSIASRVLVGGALTNTVSIAWRLVSSAALAWL